MRLFAVAVVAGLSLAAGILGLQLDGATGAHDTSVRLDREGLDRPAVQWSASARQSLVASHADANTADNPVYLNDRLIQGQATVLCTTDDEVLSQLRLAVEQWNDGLSGALPHGDDDGPFRIHPRTGSAPSSCADNRPVVDIDVVVVHESTSGSSVYDSKKSDPGQPPRKLFETDTEDAYINTEHATLIVRDPNEIKVSTIVHELGHVLGLTDHKTCAALHGQGIAHIDPDPANQHYSVMYTAADRLCRPVDQAVITDRDLRDLYEAYHVGAVTDVRVPWYPPGSSQTLQDMNPEINGDSLTLPFVWGAAGAAEAAHSASHIAIWGHYGSDGWHEIGRTAIPATGVPPEDLRIPIAKREVRNPLGPSLPRVRIWPDRYKVVGLTRGDIRWEGQRAEPSVMTHLRTFDRATSASSSETEGDPTYLIGSFVRGGAVRSYPPTLSASISPRYCWTSDRADVDRLRVSVRPGGGTVDNYSVQIAGAGTPSTGDGTQVLTFECGASSGERAISVSSNHGVGPLTGIEYHVHERPSPLAIRWAVDSALPGRTWNRPTCNASSTRVDIEWRVDGLGTANLEYFRINEERDRDLTTPTEDIDCAANNVDGSNVPLTAFALASDGRGVEQTTLTSPSSLTVSHLAGSPGQVHLTWPQVPGASGYDVRHLEGSTYSETTYVAQPSSGMRVSADYPDIATDPALTVGSAYSFEVRARRLRSRTTPWTSSSQLTVRIVQTGQLRVTSVASTSDSVTAGVAREEEGPSGGQAITYFYDLRLEERSTSLNGVAYTQRLNGQSPQNVSRHTHVFRNTTAKPNAIQAGRTYRVGARLVVAEAYGDWVDGEELAATFDLSHTAVSNTVTLSWGAISGASGYEVKQDKSGAAVPAGSASSHTFENLPAGKDYTLYVRATYGSQVSAWRSATPAPTGLTAVQRRYNLTLSWDEVTGATRYEARIGSSGTLYPLPPTPREFLFRQLEPATEYELQLRAVTPAGTSEWSVLRVSTLGLNDPQPARTPAGKPAAPSGLEVEVGEREATLSWYAVSGATGYRVSRGLVAYRLPATQFSYRFGSLQPDHDYRFYVTAESNAGRSSSSEIETRTLAEAPGLAIESATTSAQHCVTGATDVPIAWTVSGGLAPYTVAAGGAPATVSASSGSVSGLCPSAAGTGTITVTATDAGVGDAQQTASTTVAITSTAALAIAPDPATVSCVAGGTATVGWSVSGGTAPYAVQLDGAAAVTASSTSYQCPETVGAVDLSLAAADASVPRQTASGSVRVQVESADEPTVTGRIRARMLSDGRVEFEFRTSGGLSIQPSPARFATPSALTPGTWTQSSSFSATVDQLSYTVGRISVRLSCAGYIEVTLLLPDDTRESPAERYFYYKTATLNAWQRSGELTVTLSGGASGTVEFEGELLEAAGVVYPPGVDGGLMAEGLARGATEAVSTAPCTPENLETADITSSGLTLSWDPAPGAASYEVKQGDATTPATASGSTSHVFSGLSPETEYTLSVRSVRDGQRSDWAELTETTASASLPTGLEVREVSDTTATLHWTKASGADDYAVRLDGVELSASVGDVDRYAFSGLTAKRAHRLGVAAVADGVKSAFVELTLLVPPSSVTATATHESIALSWTLDAAATSAELRLGEGGEVTPADSSTAHTLDEDIEAETAYAVYVRARNDEGASAWSETSVTTAAVPISLAASASSTSCEAGAAVEVSWAVEGGSEPYAVSVAGQPASASPVSVTCQAEAGTQDVLVEVADAGAPQQRASVTLSLTVTAKPPVTLSGRLRARILADGRVEFEFRTSAGLSIPPSPARFATPSKLTPGTWKQSSSFSAPVDDVSYEVGKLSVRLSCAGYIEVTLLRPDDTRLSPTKRNFEYKTATVGAWRQSDELTVTLSSGASGRAESATALLEAAGPGAVYPPGAAGGSMAEADAAQGATAVSTAPCTPENLAAPDVTHSGLTLSWDPSPGAAGYEVKRNGATTPVAASGATSHAFSGLAPETEYTLSVRAKRGAQLSDWAQIVQATDAAPSLTGRIRARTLTDGRVEYEFRTSAGASLRPTKRFSRPADLRPGVWTSSDSFTDRVGGATYTVGKLSVRLSCAGYIEVSLLPGVGDRLLPAQRYFYYRTATVNAWRTSGAITVALVQGAAGTVGPDGDALEAAPEGALYPSGSDVGAMSAADAVQGANQSVSKAPCAPENLGTTNITGSGLTLTWEKGAGATSYEVRLGASGTAQTRPSTARSHPFSSLSAGVTYTLSVRARNASGTSDWVSLQAPTVPPAPDPSITGVGANAATLNWAAARGATGYEVRQGTSGSGLTKLGTARSHPFSGLSAGTSYTFSVRATNASGASAWVSAQTTTVPPQPVASLSGLSARAVTLNWTASRGATGYDVRQGTSGSGLTKQGTARSHPFSGLSPSTGYTWQVRARNAQGASAWTSVTATTLAETVSVSGQGAARLRSDGRVEFAFRPTGGSRITPSSRYMTPSGVAIGIWRHSSVVRGPAGGRTNLQLGKISVRRLSASTYSYIDVCFTPQGATAAICPTPNNFRYESATVDRWRYTGTITFTISLASGVGGSIGALGELLEAAPAGADDPPGTEGGLMDDDE